MSLFIQNDINQRNASRTVKVVAVALFFFNLLVITSELELSNGQDARLMYLTLHHFSFKLINAVFIMLLAAHPAALGHRLGISHSAYVDLSYVIITAVCAVGTAVTISVYGRINLAVVILHGLLGGMVFVPLRRLCIILGFGSLLYCLSSFYFIAIGDIHASIDFLRYFIVIGFALVLEVLLDNENQRYFEMRERVLKQNIKLQHKEEQLQILNARLEQQMLTDSLTGLSNRRAFDERYHQEWRRAQRSGSSLALLMIDVDHFKQLNDTQGHLKGDEALVSLGMMFRHQVKRSSDMAARIGGEEFAVLLPETNLDEAKLVGERIKAAVAMLAFKHKSSTGQFLTLSIGCHAVKVDKDTDKKILLNTADKAMYQAKNSGRNKVLAI
ncbi:GGDEF domain-containing protein [Alginatibacterium sediminis]|uniref:GGDEF domain-containing protein n=1 Tax=Alginatibacterium sediminis TaxID=2164068 RepID=UPI0011C3D372|nr:GGDEF domain-containing protein [Alginatibacterium sediminis]